MARFSMSLFSMIMFVPLLAHSAEQACQGKVDDEVSLIQLTKGMVDRNKKASPAEADADTTGATVHLDIMNQDGALSDATMTAVKSAVQGALQQEYASTGLTSPVDVSIIMGNEAPAAAAAADPTNLVSQQPNDWKNTPDGLHQPDMNTKLFSAQQDIQAAQQQLPGVPGGVPMSTPVGNITIVISPPLSVDPEQPDPANQPTTVVPANMVKGFAEPLTGVPPQAVVGYQPPPPSTAAPPPMAPGMYPSMGMQMGMPGMMPGMQMQQPYGQQAYGAQAGGLVGVPVAAMQGAQQQININALETGAEPALVGVPVDQFQNTPENLMSALVQPAAQAYANMGAFANQR